MSGHPSKPIPEKYFFMKFLTPSGQVGGSLTDILKIKPSIFVRQVLGKCVSGHLAKALS